MAEAFLRRLAQGAVEAESAGTNDCEHIHGSRWQAISGGPPGPGASSSPSFHRREARRAFQALVRPWK